MRSPDENDDSPEDSLSKKKAKKSALVTSPVLKECSVIENATSPKPGDATSGG
jgi:hypothetical protein